MPICRVACSNILFFLTGVIFCISDPIYILPTSHDNTKLTIVVSILDKICLIKKKLAAK